MYTEHLARVHLSPPTLKSECNLLPMRRNETTHQGAVARESRGRD